MRLRSLALVLSFALIAPAARPADACEDDAEEEAREAEEEMAEAMREAEEEMREAEEEMREAEAEMAEAMREAARDEDDDDDDGDDADDDEDLDDAFAGYQDLIDRVLSQHLGALEHLLEQGGLEIELDLDVIFDD